ncbi:MAG: sensor histidine kinase [Solirubrobacterales bacterium]
MPAIAEAAAVTWPLAMTVASVAVADRVRARRRRHSLNRALHELRRPLQALVLAHPSTGSRARPAARDHVGLALDALAELDREVNGAAAVPLRRREEARALAVEAVERWRWQVGVAGRRIELAWRAGAATVVCDPSRIARALDNLIANALEHGDPWVRIEGTVRSERLRLVVADGIDAGARAPRDAVADIRPEPAGATPRALVRAPRRAWQAGGFRHRGHGLGIVAAIAAEHGGRFAICRHERGASAVLELPLAES